MNLSSLAALLMMSGSLNMDLVQTAAAMLARGEDPYELEAVLPVSQDVLESLPSLAGCLPAVVQGSDTANVQIDYTCSSNEGPIVHRVAFLAREDRRMSIHVDPLGTARGPTDAAIATEKLPTERRQAFMLNNAVMDGGDPTLGGIIPLTSVQIEELKSLSHCNWDTPRKSLGSGSVWLSFIECPEFERDKGRLVELEFDSEGRAVAVRLAEGSRVRRPA